MGTALEVLGLTLPYSSGIPAVYPGWSTQFLGETRAHFSAEKAQESFKVPKYLKNLMELDLKPKFGCCMLFYLPSRLTPILLGISLLANHS